MKDTENLKKELVELSPFLAKIKKEGDGMQVPKDYFKNLPDQVLQQLPIDKEIVTKNEAGKTNQWTELFDNLIWLLQPRPAMAFASILLLFFVGLFLWNQPAEPQKSISLSDIPMEELELFFADNIEEYDAGILVEGNENLVNEGFGADDDLNDYLEDIIDESELEDLL